MSIRTENIIIVLKNLEHLLDFSNLDVNHELFSNKNKNVVKLKLKLIKNFGLKN